MKRVMLESPYSGNVSENVDYAKRCTADSLRRGEAPFVSHLLYTQDGILDDTKIKERVLGMNAGHAWLAGTELVVVYMDKGISPGMKERIKIAESMGIPIEYRSLNKGLI